MNLKLLTAAALAGSLFTASTASALTVGSVDVEALADQGAVEQGAVGNFSNIIDNSLGTYATISGTDIISFGFSGGGVVNGSGFDLYVFEGFSAFENTQLSLTLNGATIVGSFIESISNPFGSSSINTYGFDLSNLGIGSGGVATGSLFLQDNNNGPDIWGIGAVDVSDVAPVPLPATGLLLAGALGGIGLMRRRKKS